MPALRERRSDILPLATHLLQFFARQSGKAMTGFTADAQAVLLRHTWPGNVRELRNAIERGVILATGTEVGLAELPAQVGAELPKGSFELGGNVTLDALEAELHHRVDGVPAGATDAHHLDARLVLLRLFGKLD